VVRHSRRGTSGLRRARWWVTPTRGDPRESATENRPPRPLGPGPDGRGKGETVVQETTSAPGDRCGSANPTGSKARQGAFEGCSPELPGRPLEAHGNVRRRWMAATRAGVTARGDRTRRTGRLIRSTNEAWLRAVWSSTSRRSQPILRPPPAQITWRSCSPATQGSARRGSLIDAPATSASR